MLLLTAHVWFGPGRGWPQNREPHATHERLEGLATRMRLPQAIEKIKTYSEAFGGEAKLSAVVYSIVSVARIDPLTDDQIHDAGMRLVEHMEWTDD